MSANEPEVAGEATPTGTGTGDGEALEISPGEPVLPGVDLARAGQALDAVLRDLRGDERRIERSLEALLVSTRVPLSVEDMAGKLGLALPVVEAALLRLTSALEERALGLFHRDKEGKRVYILDVKAAYRPDVAAVAPPLLKQTVTETLALIAMNQPIPQARLVRERGTGVYEHVKELMDRGLVQRGRQGRSYVLRTTDGFAAEFGLPNDPEVIKKALARAAGVQGDPEIMGSPRVHLQGTGAPAEGVAIQGPAAELLDEARRVAAERPPLPAPVTPAAGDVAPQPEAGQPPSRLPSDAFEAIPGTSDPDCMISGGEPPLRNQAPEGEVAPAAPERVAAKVPTFEEDDAVKEPEVHAREEQQDTRSEEEVRGDQNRIARLLALTGDGGGDDW